MRLRAALLAATLALLALTALPATAGAVAAATASSQQISEQEAIRFAGRDEKVVAERQEHPHLTPTAALVDGNWQVDYFSGDTDLVQVIVDPNTGVVRESWTGYQVAWKMARGYPGAFGHKLNAPYVWLPLCAIFLLGLVDWRRPFRVANLDLLVLLSFGASQYFFNRGDIGLSVPLQYPPLIYLFARMLWIGFRGRGQGLRPVWPTAWLLIAALFLLGFRGGLNVADSGVIDVGYAGVVGADRVADGKPIYGAGNFPDNVSFGDTYGPVNYYSYVPFEQIWPWSGDWDDLPAAHAAAIFFDLATFAGLLWLGRRLRPGPEGRRLGVVLGFAWAAFPYAAFVLEANANDSLVALLLVLTMAVIARPVARGAGLALAGLTKFSPFVLTPLLATYQADPYSRAFGGRSRRRETLLFAGGFAAAGALAMLPAIIDPGISTFWHRTIASQIDRDSPFSVWGQVPSLEPLRVALIAAVGLLALLVALRPRRKSAAQVAALAAALMIGTQLFAQHWFYLYIVWFAPLSFVAFAAVSPRWEPVLAQKPEPGRWDQARPPLPSPTHLPQPSRSEPASA
jgi:hypothetical protein